MTGPWLTLPCETQAREFDAKLLLACVGAERGFHVIVGAKKEIDRRLASLPRSTYLSKSLTGRNLKIHQLLRDLGHRILLGDEEGLVYPSPATYLATKVDPRVLHQGDAMLAWGPEIARIWRESMGDSSIPIHVTGNPRFDLLREPLRAWFADAVAALRARHAPYLLVNTNFSRINHYFPRHSRQRLALETSTTGGSNAALLGLAAHKQALFDHFAKMVPVLARGFPDCQVIVRPHPSENQQTWRELADLPNLRVINEGSVVPWLLGAQAVIHNGCTTAVEAYVLGATAIAYQPVRSNEFDLELPNRLSLRALDLEQLLSTIAARLRGEQPDADPTLADRAEVAARHIAGLSGPLAAERIMDAVAAGLEAARAGDHPSRPRRLGAVARARWRALRKLGESYLPGHHNNKSYLRHMFPGVSQAQARDQVASYGAILGRFGSVRVRELFSNVFEVTPA